MNRTLRRWLYSIFSNSIDGQSKIFESTRAYRCPKSFQARNLVSIILPIHDSNPFFLLESINSCLSQTYQNIELLIVDDGSRVDIAKMVKPFMRDKRVKLIVNRRNLKLPTSLNRGFKAAKGKYLTWTSDDNIYSQEAIESMVGYLVENNKDFVCADYYLIDGENKLLKLEKVEFFNEQTKKNTIGPCFLYTRRLSRKIGEYKKDKFLSEDYDYWSRSAKTFELCRLHKALYFYRIHNRSLTSKHGL